MKLTPVLTEKSLKVAKDGKFSFWVIKSLTKNQIREQIEETFGVHVTSIKTINFKKETKRNFKRQLVTKGARKKAIVTLAKDEKIDLFEEKTK